MNFKSDIDPEILRLRLRYCRETGLLFWKESEICQKGWNTRWAGKEAFTAYSRDGYKRGTVFRKGLQAHRVVWAIYYGEWPEGNIDHIDHDKTNNRIENLRIVTNVENQRNMSKQKRNKSGVTGVHWKERDNRWQASIGVNGKTKALGYFKNFEDAVSRRKIAEIEYGFHENHGM